jgi:hypothetical protein
MLHSQSPPIRTLWARRVAITTAILFFISTAFPVVAGLARDTTAFPKWWGRLDVMIAFALAMMVIVMSALVGSSVTKEAEGATYRAYRILTHGILAMLVAFFLFGDRITWINCLTGFAWRAWLLLYSLPAWFTALSDQQERPVGENLAGGTEN